MSYHTFSAVLGCAMGLIILYLVRRDHLRLGKALFWMAFAVASIIFGAMPGASDRLAALFGIAYGPTLVILVAVAALILRALQADIQQSQMERSLRRLTQRLAMLEAELQDTPTNTPQPKDPAPQVRTDNEATLESEQ